MAQFYKSGNIYDAWMKAVKTVLVSGKEISDERGSKTKEVLNLIIEIGNISDMNRQHSYWKGEKLDDYCNQLMDRKDKGFSYDYGNRFRGYFQEKRLVDYDTHNNPHILSNPVDQLQKVLLRLAENSNTRRAVMITFDPTVDHEKEDIPCILVVDFKIRNSSLHTTVFWRSNDIYGAYYPNVVAVSRIAKHVSEKLEIDLGTLTTHTASAHIYESDYESAERDAGYSISSYEKMWVREKR